MSFYLFVYVLTNLTSSFKVNLKMCETKFYSLNHHVIFTLVGHDRTC